MVAVLPTESQSDQIETTEEGSQSESDGQAAGWTSADLEELADKVYDLMMKDLMLERERGLW